jgi:hypothetical protein
VVGAADTTELAESSPNAEDDGPSLEEDLEIDPTTDPLQESSGPASIKDWETAVRLVVPRCDDCARISLAGTLDS